MQPATLYSFRRCPYAMRARMALAIGGHRVALREIALRAKPDQMLAASPKGTVPVLVAPDGAVIDESLDIVRWALALHDPEDWAEGDDRALIAANDGPFKHHLDRYKYADRHDSYPIEHRAAALALLAPLEARLRDCANLTRDDRALADIAIFPFVRQFAATDPDWFAALPMPRVQAWLSRHIASPLFESVMVRLKPWQEGDPDIFLPTALSYSRVIG
ncbi:glutathione S-transferase [soil metagenome]